MLMYAVLSDANFDAVLAKLRFDAERDAVRQKVGLAAPAAAPAAFGEAVRRGPAAGGAAERRGQLDEKETRRQRRR